MENTSQIPSKEINDTSMKAIKTTPTQGMNTAPNVTSPAADPPFTFPATSNVIAQEDSTPNKTATDTPYQFGSMPPPPTKQDRTPKIVIGENGVPRPFIRTQSVLPPDALKFVNDPSFTPYLQETQGESMPPPAGPPKQATADPRRRKGTNTTPNLSSRTTRTNIDRSSEQGKSAADSGGRAQARHPGSQQQQNQQHPQHQRPQPPQPQPGYPLPPPAHLPGAEHIGITHIKQLVAQAYGSFPASNQLAITHHYHFTYFDATLWFFYRQAISAGMRMDPKWFTMDENMLRAMIAKTAEEKEKLGQGAVDQDAKVKVEALLDRMGWDWPYGEEDLWRKA